VNGPTDFGGGLVPHISYPDAFLASYDSSGSYRWAFSFGNQEWNRGLALAVDEQGNVTFGGKFRMQLEFGESSVSSVGDSDAFMAGFTSEGSNLWSKSYGGSADDYFSGLAHDGAGGIFAIGQFQSTVDFDVEQLANSGDYWDDLVLLHANVHGQPVWVRRFGDVGRVTARAVALGAGGYVHLFGDLLGQADLGMGLSEYFNTSTVFVLTYDTNGDPVWQSILSGSGQEHGLAVAVDQQRCIYISGWFTESLHTDIGDLATAGDLDIFVASYYCSGQLRWAMRLGGINRDELLAMTVDPDGNVYLAGEFWDGFTDIGGIELEDQQPSTAFLAKLSPNIRGRRYIYSAAELSNNR
jgi:hypothetical protein